MEQRRCLLALTLLLALLASCSPGHLGSNVLAFVRDGQLWTVDPNGANAFAIVAQEPRVVGYGWSPNHQLVAFRTLDTNFARTPQARTLAQQPLTGMIGDIPGTLNTVGVDGGSPIAVAFSSSDVRYSNLIWSPSGKRLLFRQTPTTPPKNPGEPLWWVVQNDQPGGIAARSLPESYAIPSLSSDGNMAIGNSYRGIFTTTIAGTEQRFLTAELPGHPLAATLERVLWQPVQQQPQILYALPAAPQQGRKDAIPPIQLMLRSLGGQSAPLTTCSCTQFAWSPNGRYVLYSEGPTYTVININDKATFTIKDENGAVPYWSPDSQFLLLDGLHHLTLADIATKQYKTVLSDGQVPAETKVTLPSKTVLLQPVVNSIWAADSRHFLFLTHDRLLWEGQHLSPGKGLYTVTIDDRGQRQGAPVVVDTGNDSQAGWTYQDANTSFLF